MKENQYECFPIDLKSYGILSAKFSDSQLAPIKSEIIEIQKKFDSQNNRKYNSELAGNIRQEYKLIQSEKYLEKLVMPMVDVYDSQYDYLRFSQLSKIVPIMLSDSWVNFQEKYEFNPAHCHDGILSFVIWIKVPYDMKNEIANSPGANSRYNTAGMFSLQYTSTLGTIITHDVQVDKSTENCILLFPAKMVHCVYPFFTSDEYRISVSGNFKFKID
jgi:hypothetical protein